MDIVIKTSPLFHNCGFHVIAPFIAAFLNPTEIEQEKFQHTLGYQYFLSAFSEYYHLENDAQLHSKIINLLEKHADPLAIQILLGPVLRITLKKILNENQEHKDSLKESFKLLVEQCKEEYEREGLPDRIEWLSGLEFTAKTEHEELFTPNISLIAKLLKPSKLSRLDAYWDQVYQNYCNYLGDPLKGVFVSADHLGLLCHHFGLGFTHAVNLTDTFYAAQDPHDYVLATVKAINPTGDHWELVSGKKNTCDLTQSPFSQYHDYGVAIFSQDKGSPIVKYLQDTFRNKINQFITKDIPYTEEKYGILPSWNWEFHDGLEGLANLIAQSIQSDQSSPLLATPRFSFFLNAFREYYELSSELALTDVHAKLRELLNAYTAEQEQFMILSPVLKKIYLNLSREPEHESSTEEDSSNSQLTCSSLVNLYHFFRVGLNVYADRDTGRVSCFDKNVELKPNDMVACLDVAKDEEGVIHSLCPNLLDAFIATATLPFSPKPSLSENKVRIIECLKTGKYPCAPRLINDISALLDDFNQGKQIHSKGFNKELLKLSLDTYEQNNEFSLALLRLLLLSFYRENEKNTQSLRFKSNIFGLIDSAVKQGASIWVKQFLEDLKTIPELLTKEAVFESFLAETHHKILNLIATAACEAVRKKDRSLLVTCLTAHDGCLTVAGVNNPLHLAFQLRHSRFVQRTYVYYQQLMHRSRISEWALDHFNGLADKAYDKYDRTLRFRMDRAKRHKDLDRALAKSNGWRESALKRGSITKFQIEEAGIWIIDQGFYKTKHTLKVNLNPIYKYGTPIMLAIKNLGMIASAGPLKYGLTITGQITSSILKAPLIHYPTKLIGFCAPYVGIKPETAEFCTKFALENGPAIVFMPEYFVLSNALNTITYFAVKDSGHDKLEALAHLLTDGLAYSWAAGSQSDYQIDDRYSYHMKKNLAGCFGETAADWMTPVFVNIDKASLYLNERINYPVEILKPYIPQFSITFPDIFDQLYAKLPDVSFLGERVYQYAERSILEFLPDSPFKAERLHAFKAFETSRLRHQQTQLEHSHASQQILDEHQKLIEASIDQEEQLFKQTPGAKYFEDWQDSYVALKNGQVQPKIKVDDLKILQEKEAGSLTLSKFYNTEATNLSAKGWAEHLDDIYERNKDNFADWSNPDKVFWKIVHDTFYHSTDRNKMAQFCADEIIRRKYPLYPDLGDKVKIEEERAMFFDTIVKYKLDAFQRKPARAREFVHEYLEAVLGGKPEPRHKHGWEKVVKTFANEVMGEIAGWRPFPDFKGGERGRGHVGAQVYKGIGGGGGYAVDMTVANRSILRLYDSQPHGKMEVQIPKPLAITKSAQTEEESAVVTPQVISTADHVMSFESPYIQGIVEELFEENFEKQRKQKKQKEGDVKKPKKESKKQSQKAELISTSEELSQGVRKPFKHTQTHVNPHPKLAVFLKGVDESKIPLTSLPRLTGEAVMEFAVDLVTGAISLAEFVGEEAVRGLKGEELETVKAVELLKVFIGEEAARIALREQTETGKYVQELVHHFEDLSPEERVKAIGKIPMMVAMPNIGVGQVKKLLPVVEKVLIPLKIPAKEITPQYRLKTDKRPGITQYKQTGGRDYKDIFSIPSYDALAQDQAAAKIYDMIRENKLDIEGIAKNTGRSVKQIERIKNHLFYNKHKLRDGYERFWPDYEIGSAWRRLESNTFSKSDVQLLNHEYFESRFEGIFKVDYAKAHDAANRSGRFSGLTANEEKSYLEHSSKPRRFIMKDEKNGYTHIARKDL